jgi:DNA-binding ferritin-like protein
MTCRAITAPGIFFKALIANGKNMTNSNEVGERREVGPLDMLGELREDNEALVARMIQIHDLCDETNDVATASFSGELDRSNVTPGLVSV